MWPLIRKDLILDRRMVGLNFAMYLVMGPVFMSLMSQAPVKLFAAWAGIIGAMIPLSLVGREDKFKTAALTCSLPVTRDLVVASRYVGGWFLSLGGGLAVLATCYAVARAGLANPVGAWGAGLLVTFVTTGLILAGLIPFTMRFGLVGLIGFLVVLQVLGIVAFLGAVFVGGHGALRTLIRGVIETVQALREPLGPIGYGFFLVGLVVVSNVASFHLSRWIYRRREF